MIERLSLQGVGPAPGMSLDFAPRFNLLTGDNGLGKSFVLDVVWWALTRSWSSLPARPSFEHLKNGAVPEISLSSTDSISIQATYDREREEWALPPGRPYKPGLVLYVRVDGGFSVWDPARNYWRDEERRKLQAFHFEPSQVWKGLEVDGTPVCNGLIDDWTTWRIEDMWRGHDPDQPQDVYPGDFQALLAALQKLSPSDDLPLEPDEPRRLTALDTTMYPTLRFPYGVVPVTHASAGVRRILSVAYLLVWMWREHLQACELRGQDPERRILVLYDEVETHLHPRWQRRILPALHNTVQSLAQQLEVQVVASTHAPLVLASLEPLFSEDRDRVFHFRQEGSQVTCEPVPWVPQGDATNWLVSEVFGLEQARSVEAEQAIEAAEAFMRGEAKPGLETRDKIHKALLRALPEHDPFWPRWIVRTGQ